MENTMTSDELLFGFIPYAAVMLAIAGTLWRAFNSRFSVSSLSSQFLESRRLFWGSVPWHYGILIILAGHLIAFLIPRSVLAWNGVPWRLYVLEAAGLAFGILTLWGLVVLIVRRASSSRLRVVTSGMDVVLLLALLIQVVAGIWTAIFYRWGSSWYAGFAVPYLYSLFKLSPDISLVANLPFMVKVHIVGAFALIALLPFTRLIHFLTFPITYLWRPYQVVIWNRKKATRS
jgi:nitrate reductase gamma subunit